MPDGSHAHSPRGGNAPTPRRRQWPAPAAAREPVAADAAAAAAAWQAGRPTRHGDGPAADPPAAGKGGRPAGVSVPPLPLQLPPSGAR